MTTPTLPIPISPQGPPNLEGRGGRVARGRGRRRVWAALIAVVVLLLLVLAAVVGDNALRTHVAGLVKDGVEQSLPEGVEGEVVVRVGGFSAIQQYLAGSFDDIEITSENLDVNGNPVEAHVLAAGLPVDSSKPVRTARGTLALDEATVNSLVQIEGVDSVTLGDGELGIAGSTALLGFPIDYTATATPVLEGDTVVFTPTDAKINGADVPFADQILSAIAQDRLSVCVAEYLPKDVSVSGISIRPGRLTVAFRASSLVLDEQTLAERGSCG